MLQTRAHVIAVVPAFEATDELVTCVRALLSQTHRLMAIYVIDNAPSAGTPEILEAGRDASPATELVYVPLTGNSGSMGGFSEGMRRAYEAGADWIWLVDQDSSPTPTCLERLLAHGAESGILGPIAVPALTAAELSFPIWDGEHNRIVRRVDQSRTMDGDGVIKGDLCVMNGCLLIRNEVVRSIGTMRAEMFHWGGEIEYALKASRHGFEPLVVVDAVNVHPRHRLEYRELLFGRQIEVPRGRLNSYCYHRNLSFIYSRYYGVLPFFRRALDYTWFYLVTSGGDFRGLLGYAWASRDGLFSHWGREKRYLERR